MAKKSQERKNKKYSSTTKKKTERDSSIEGTATSQIGTTPDQLPPS